MIPNDQPERGQMIKRMLDVLLDESCRIDLTKWESDFIFSLNDQFEKRRNLSNRQCEILERIYDKV